MRCNGLSLPPQSYQGAEGHDEPVIGQHLRWEGRRQSHSNLALLWIRNCYHDLPIRSNKCVWGEERRCFSAGSHNTRYGVTVKVSVFVTSFKRATMTTT